MNHGLGFLVTVMRIPTVAIASAPEPQADPFIRHVGLECWPREQFVQLVALVEPLGNIEHVNVFFRSDKYPDFYFVEMSQEGDSFQAVMPIPSEETSRVIYYIEAVDRSMNVACTDDNAPHVTSGSECAVKGVLGVPAITIGSLVEGAAKMPPGFLATGIVGAVAATSGVGAAATAGAGGGGTGGGLSGLTIGAIVGGAAAGAGVIVAASGEESSTQEVIHEVGSNCHALNQYRSGQVIVFQYGVGCWPTPEEIEADLEGHSPIVTVDGQSLPVSYEGATWHTGGGEPAGWGNRARARWIATAGRHVVTALWTVHPEDIVSCTFEIPP